MKSEKEIVKMVEDILTECNIYSSPIPIGDIAEYYGFIVVEGNLKESGFLFIDDKGLKVGDKLEKRVIGVNSADSVLRQRFTVAHELAHFFLEIKGKQKSCFLHRELRDENYDSEKERLADLFASELLVPSGLLNSEMAKLDGIDLMFESIPNMISKYFKVSLSCAEIRYERYRRSQNG